MEDVVVWNSTLNCTWRPNCNTDWHTELQPLKEDVIIITSASPGQTPALAVQMWGFFVLCFHTVLGFALPALLVIDATRKFFGAHFTLCHLRQTLIKAFISYKWKQIVCLLPEMWCYQCITKSTSNSLAHMFTKYFTALSGHPGSVLKPSGIICCQLLIFS